MARKKYANQEKRENELESHISTITVYAKNCSDVSLTATSLPNGPKGTGIVFTGLRHLAQQRGSVKKYRPAEMLSYPKLAP